jgi:hypothetical protein
MTPSTPQNDKRLASHATQIAKLEMDIAMMRLDILAILDALAAVGIQLKPREIEMPLLPLPDSDFTDDGEYLPDLEKAAQEFDPDYGVTRVKKAVQNTRKFKEQLGAIDEAYLNNQGHRHGFKGNPKRKKPKGGRG